MSLIGHVETVSLDEYEGTDYLPIEGGRAALASNMA